MDRTAIAAIIIGFGATIAAMVFPTRHPNARKWAVNLSWWGGILLVIAGSLVLVTEITARDLYEWAIVSYEELLGLTISAIHLPAVWITLAFAAGAAANRWGPAFWKQWLKHRRKGPRVLEWLSPAEAVARFVAKDLVARDRLAQEGTTQLKQRIQNLEENPDQSATLAEARKELEEAEYLAKRRRTDVIERLLVTLKMGLLVGKGYPMKRKKGVWVRDEVMTTIPAGFWKITIDNVDILNVEAAKAVGYLGVYLGVVIGRDEDHKELQKHEPHPGAVIKY
jgi:hypothetical protein